MVEDNLLEIMGTMGGAFYGKLIVYYTLIHVVLFNVHVDALIHEDTLIHVDTLIPLYVDTLV